ncbi:MAG: hypothetical protein GAK30_01910 [Paracidovorax wautersii]|uniref:Tripartite-type tricarboxylate transporter, receptor component TctC n=1 Tax=Paracidovorax wautersii TaxID=1177982 RepID=A0A7V8JQK7_9BURK|nr:MAG: hypothetical protein GAK30_01910 [Paracidovorax wautersii]
MNRNRRQTCAALMAAALTVAWPLAGRAQQTYPDRTITLLVPFSPGGGTDIAARLMADQLGKKLGQAVVVDNRAGAAGQIAADAVARAKPDGYTLLFANSGLMAINPWLYKLSHDPARDFEPVSMFADLPFALVASPKVQARTVPQLVEQLRAQPDQFTFASSGSGGAPHLAGEKFQLATGTKMTHVPYKGGGPAMADLVAGHVDLLFASVLETASYVKSGKLVALAVTGPQRSPVLPDVPTLTEAGIRDADTGSWTAVLAPKGTPKAIVDQLSATIREVAQLPDVQQRLSAQGAVARGSTPEQLRDVAALDRGRYGELIRARNLKVD